MYLRQQVCFNIQASSTSCQFLTKKRNSTTCQTSIRNGIGRSSSPRQTLSLPKASSDYHLGVSAKFQISFTPSYLIKESSKVYFGEPRPTHSAYQFQLCLILVARVSGSVLLAVIERMNYSPSSQAWKYFSLDTYWNIQGRFGHNPLECQLCFEVFKGTFGQVLYLISMKLLGSVLEILSHKLFMAITKIVIFKLVPWFKV